MDNINYCENKLRNVMEPLMLDLLTSRPRDVVSYSIDWLRKKGDYTTSGLKTEEKLELEELRKSIQKYRLKEEESSVNNTTNDNVLSEESV